ncbi:hypothetical protein B0H19DRAFT_1071002 [Mycena capillaripes]|nr:hypothetical protein B0H19DRAFT_1071002 [Mycena capillaripes]
MAYFPPLLVSRMLKSAPSMTAGRARYSRIGRVEITLEERILRRSIVQVYNGGYTGWGELLAALVDPVLCRHFSTSIQCIPVVIEEHLAGAPWMTAGKAEIRKPEVLRSDLRGMETVKKGCPLISVPYVGCTRSVTLGSKSLTPTVLIHLILT